jgi:hypothetical protein
MKRVKKPLFESDDLALCVLDALVSARKVKTNIRVPELGPRDDDDTYDPDDESESWRDGDSNQDEPIRRLVALLEENRDKLAQVVRVRMSVPPRLAMSYWPRTSSVVGIAACTKLRELDLVVSEPTIDLRPLRSLPLRSLTLKLPYERGATNLKPLHQIETLRQVKGTINRVDAAELEKRKIKVTTIW